MNTPSTRSEAALRALIADARAIFLSPREVSARLAEIAQGNFAEKLQIALTQKGERYIWGEFEADPPQVVQSGTLLGEVTYEVRANAWPRSPLDQKLLPLFAELAGALWGDDMRPMGGLQWKRESVRSRLTASIEHLAEGAGDARSIAVLFGDLDKFKDLNAAVGHHAADEAIRYVNRSLHDACLRHGGLPFHPSGDEFYLVLPMNGLLETLSALHDLRLDITRRTFTDGGTASASVDLTLGMQILSASATYESVDQALRDAEAATKDGTEKRRGQLSIVGSNIPAGPPVDARTFARLGATMVRRRNGSDGPFPDARLGLIVERVRTLTASHDGLLDDEVAKTTSWLGVITNHAGTMESLLDQRAPVEVPVLAIALSVASGILSSHIAHGKSEKIELSFNTKGECAVLVAGSPKWGSCPNPDDSVIIRSATDESSAPCVIGVQFGLKSRPKVAATSLALPTDVLEHVVIVDDRPGTGGGLPDFWQAALAQICEVAAPWNGPVHVLLWGTNSESTETYKRLIGQKEWPDDEVAALAGVKAKQVSQLREGLKPNVKLVTDQQLADAMYDLLGLRGQPAQPTARADSKVALPRAILESSKLRAVDGLRCRDAMQAYPLVIDVLRKSDARMSSDDALQELRELVAFKVVLESPTSNPVPAYLRDQSEEMDLYFERVLNDRHGQLREPLEASHQIEAFIAQLVDCVGVDGSIKSTRRACLVVPHAAKAGALPSPQGLVSVWASPRVEETERLVVDFVYVWRTVEAFVGFPYSLFGSIRLAQTLLQSVSQTLEGKNLPKDVRLGELTYFALSLHMRVDGVHQRIAKRIVDESSD